ncbi:hypothetical protein SUDANB145_06836 [Streptomyces sp. enrichment culture]
MAFSDTLNELYHLPAVDFPGVGQEAGLPAAVVRGIAASELPALEHLDVWLGTSWYGADSEPVDVAPILEGSRLPRLRHLALRDSEIQGAIAVAAAALLAGQPLTHLLAVEGVDVDLSEDRTEDDKNEDGTVARFVAAGE